jgi:flagellar M-ring protein FliF
MLTSSADDVAGLSSSQLEYQRNYEKDMESRIIGILEPVAGKNRIRTKVTASLDFTKIEKTEEKFDPDGQVVRSEQKNNEKSSSGGSGGVPGVASNLPGKSGSQTASSQGQAQKQNETINYEISKVTSHVINSSGDVKKLSVAVIVDGAITEQQGSKEKKYVPRSEEDLKHYEDLVKKAIGFTADRGDEVRVVNLPFEHIVQDELPAVSKSYLPIILSAAKYLVPLAAVLLLFLFVIKPLIVTLSVPSSAQRVPALPFPRTVAEIESAMRIKGVSMQPEVIEWARKNPEQAANLVKGWIEER